MCHKKPTSIGSAAPATEIHILNSNAAASDAKRGIERQAVINGAPRHGKGNDCPAWPTAATKIPLPRREGLGEGLNPGARFAAGYTPIMTDFTTRAKSGRGSARQIRKPAVSSLPSRVRLGMGWRSWVREYLRFENQPNGGLQRSHFQERLPTAKLTPSNSKHLLAPRSPHLASHECHRLHRWKEKTQRVAKKKELAPQLVFFVTSRVLCGYPLSVWIIYRREQRKRSLLSNSLCYLCSLLFISSETLISVVGCVQGRVGLFVDPNRPSNIAE